MDEKGKPGILDRVKNALKPEKLSYGNSEKKEKENAAGAVSTGDYQGYENPDPDEERWGAKSSAAKNLKSAEDGASEQEDNSGIRSS